MRKNYALLVVFMLICFTANAQLTDDFETYPVGLYHGGNWSSWSGSAGAEDIMVSTNFAFDGTNSGLIGGNTVQDAMLVLGNITSGVYALTFQVYIPTGKSGYMNFQGTTTASGGATGGGVFNSPNLVFNNVQSTSGAPGMGGAYGSVADAAAQYTWTYPENTWFPIVIEFDIDNGIWTMTINGIGLPSQPFDDENVLGAIDLFSFDANNEMYIDAISFVNTLSLEDESLSSFNSYPNPVTDYLYVSTQSLIDLVVVYDILGHKINSITPTSINHKIDFTNLASGAYFVKAIIGNQSKTIKVIK